MQTNNVLKGSLFTNLSNYKLIEEYFSESINLRMQRDNWLDNGLVQIILKNIDVNLRMISDCIASVHNHDARIVTEIFKDLSGKDKDYDRRINDILAELRAAEWLIGQGFSRITKIPRSQNKTPDFKCKKDSCNHLIEVKNLRAPNEYLHILFTKITALAFIYNDLMAYKAVHLTVTPDDLTEHELSFADFYNIELFLKKLIDSVTDEKLQVIHKYRVDELGGRHQRSILAEIEETERFYCSGALRRIAINLSDPKRRQDMVLPLFRKVIIIFELAMRQLFSYDENDDFAKSILINWEKTTEFDFDTESADVFSEMINRFNDCIQALNSKTQIIIM